MARQIASKLLTDRYNVCLIIDKYFYRYGTRVDYIYCNENVRTDWKLVSVKHSEEDFSDHSAVVATLEKNK